MRRNSDLKYLVVHHGDSPGKYGSFESYRRYHVEKLGWDSIAYDFLIDDGGAGEFDKPEGTVIICPRWFNQLGRSLVIPVDDLKQDTVWNHILSIDKHYVGAGEWRKTPIGISANRCAVHVVFCGDYDDKMPTERMLMSGMEVFARLQIHFGIPFSRIIKHSDLSSKSCPGRAFPFSYFKKRISARVLELRGETEREELEIPPSGWSHWSSWLSSIVTTHTNR